MTTPFCHKEIKEVAALVKKFNKSLTKDVTVEYLEARIASIAYEYLHTSTGYVGTYGVVFSFFNDHNKERAVKFSLSHTLFRK